MIRQAELRDVPQLVELGKAMVVESEIYRHLGYNEEKVLNSAYYWIQDPTFIVLVYEHEGQVVGLIAGQLMYAWFSDAVIAADHAWFVHPDYRGTINSVRLIREYRRIATEMGASLVKLENTSGVNTERVAKAVMKNDFRFAGYTFYGLNGE